MSKKVIGIYLAAGKSTRFNGSKLIASAHGKSLGSIALTEALHTSLDHVIVVIHSMDSLAWLPASFRRDYADKLSIVTCQDSEYGMAHSLQRGLHAINAMDDRAAMMVLLADQAFVTRAQLNIMIDLYQQEKDYACVGLQHTYISPPLIISRCLFSQLYQLKGDEGARRIIEGNRHASYFIKAIDPIVFIDIDTREDFDNWMDLLAR